MRRATGARRRQFSTRRRDSASGWPLARVRVVGVRSGRTPARVERSSPAGADRENRNLTRMQLIRTVAAWRPDPAGYRDPVTATRLAMRSLARRYLELHDEIADLDAPIRTLVEELAPDLLTRTGVGVESAGQLLVTAGDNPERLRFEAAFAMLCGASPLPPSSGKTVRHRLNRGGDRAANSALHMIAISRWRTDPTNLGLRRPLHRRRHVQTRDSPLPQALRRPRGLLRPTQPGTRDQPHPDRRLTHRRASGAASSGRPRPYGPSRARAPQERPRSGNAGHTGELLVPLRPITHETRTAARHESTSADPGGTTQTRDSAKPGAVPMVSSAARDRPVMRPRTR
jgi:hypothetical protein